MSDFWSRRRAAVEAEHKTALAEAMARDDAQTEAELTARDDAELLSELDLPEPEALDSPEAVRDFLSKSLPQRLKTRALRRLWRLNPVLANLDGLVDYGEDFTDSATVIENLQTAYQVGKGMLKHVEALAAKAEAEETDAAEDLTDPDPEADDQPTTDEDLATTAEAPAPAIAAVPYPTDPDDDMPPAPLRRRMAFTFDPHA
ncbi:MAG: DUF3306 domain-containing protein [Pseudomonadota bacterium]